jgi:hypothetical protein
MEFYTKIIKIIQEEKYRMSGRLDEMSLTTQTMTEMLQEALSKNSKESKDVLDKLTPVFTTGMNTLKLHKEKIDALQSLEDDFKQKKGTLESVLEAKGGAKKGRKKSSNVKATSKKPRK